MKPKIFIGSSSESLFIAEALKVYLEDHFEVSIWHSIFKQGQYFLESLYKQLYLTDFGLFIIAPDDRVYTKGKKEYSTRDNVIFELGMFIGVLGIKKTYFIVTDLKKGSKDLKIKLPSDLDGIKKARLNLELTENYELIDNSVNEKSIKDACARIKSDLADTAYHMTLSLLPSTSLAIGYFNNFILPSCDELSKTKDFEVNGEFYDLSKDIFDFNIIIPDGGRDAGHAAYNRFVRANDLKQIEIRSRLSPRTFPFFIETKVKDGRIKLYDLPTTLRASYTAIRLVMPLNTTPQEYRGLEIKEISNFMHTIEHLLGTPDAADFRDNIHLVTASELFK